MLGIIGFFCKYQNFLSDYTTINKVEKENVTEPLWTILLSINEER